MKTTRLRRIICIAILVIFAVVILLMVLLLPGFLSDNSVSECCESETVIEKRVRIIADDLSDKSRYDSVMQLKSMFDDYKNTEIKVYDSQADSQKQSFYLSDALSTQIDAVIVYPVEMDFIKDDLEKLHKQDVPVIVVGHFEPDPNYLAVGYNLRTAGKLQAQSTYSAIANSNIMVFSKATNSDSALTVLDGFSVEIRNRSDIKVTDVVYTAGLSKETFSQQLELASRCGAVVVQDPSTLPAVIDALNAARFQGFIMGITADKDMLQYVLRHTHIAVIYQDPDQLNRQIFDELMASFKEIRANRFVDVHQSILNTYNISEYLNE